jgi:hypothetical protein
MNVIATPFNDAPLTSRANFCRAIGRTTVTLWRWEKLGWIDPAINIAGKPFYTREAIERFTRRASAGEFARAPHAPAKARATA